MVGRVFFRAGWFHTKGMINDGAFSVAINASSKWT